MREVSGKKQAFNFQRDVLDPVGNSFFSENKTANLQKPDNYKLSFLDESKLKNFNDALARIDSLEGEYSNSKTVLNDLKVIDSYLIEATKTLEARAELAKRKESAKFDLKVDAAFALLSTSVLAAAKSIGDQKEAAKKAINDAFFSAAGLPPEVSDQIDQITDIKKFISDPKEIALFLWNFGSDVVDSAKLAVVVAQIEAGNPLLPDAILKKTQEKIAEIQNKQDKTKAEVVESILGKLETIKHNGLLPDDSSEIEKIKMEINFLNEYLSNLRKRVLEEKDESKSIKFENEIARLEKRRAELPLWLASAFGQTSVDSIEKILGDFGLKLLSKLASNDPKMVRIDREIRTNPQIVMAQHIDHSLRVKNPKSFPSVNDEVKFLIKLTEQHLKAQKELASIASTLVSENKNSPRLDAIQRLLNERKIAAAVRIVAQFPNAILDYDFQKLTNNALTKEMHQATAKIKFDAAIKLLTELNVPEQSEKDKVFNKKINEQIEKLQQHYDAAFPAHEIKNETPDDFEIITEEEIEKAYIVSSLGKEIESEIDNFLEQMKNDELLAGEIAMESRDSAIAKRLVRQGDKYDVENLQSAGIGLTDAGKKESQRQADLWDAQWAKMATVFSEPNMAFGGAPQFANDPRIAIMQARAKELLERHEKRDALSDSRLDPQALHLADMSPFALKKFANILRNASAAINAASEMQKDEKEILGKNIERKQQAIAISMYERLLLAQENKSADLMHYAGLVDKPSNAYRLSDSDVVFFMKFIVEHGSPELQAKVASELVSTEAILKKMSAPFNNAMSDYWKATATKNTEAIFIASQSLVANDSFILTFERKSELNRQLDAINSKTDMVNAFEDNLQALEAKTPGSVPKTPEEKLDYLNAMLEKDAKDNNKPFRKLSELPAQTLEKMKQKYNSDVRDAMSPLKMATSRFGDHVKAQYAAFQKKSDLHESDFLAKEKTLQAKIDACSAKIAAPAPSWFERTTFRWKIPPWITVSEKEYKEKLAKELSNVQSDLNKAKAEMADLRSNFQAEKEQLDQNNNKMIQHIVQQVRDQAISGELTSNDADKIRELIEKIAPNLKAELARKLDFMSSFTNALVDQAPLRELQNVMLLISKFEKNADKKHAAENILSLLQGDISTLPKNDAAQWLRKNIDFLAESKLTSQKYADILEHYIMPKIIEQLDINDPDYDKTVALVSLYDDASDQQVLLNRCVEHCKDDPERLFSLFKVLYAFSNADDYFHTRESLFDSYFVKRIDEVFDLILSGNYSNEEYMKDQFVFIAARDALLDDEVGSQTAPQKKLNETMTQLLAGEPLPKWNHNLAKLIEEFAEPALVQHYRMLRLNEFVADAALGVSSQGEAAAFKQFIDSCRDPKPTRNNLTPEQTKIIQTLLNDPNPTAMHDIIVREFGTEKQLQDMHAKWLIAVLRSANEPNTNQGRTEAIVRELMDKLNADYPNLGANEKLQLFVGIENMKSIRAELVRALADKEGLVEPVNLEGKKTNEVEVISDTAAQKLRITAGGIVENLLPAFPGIGKELTDLNEKRLAERDLNVLTKLYHETITNLDTKGMVEALDLSGLQAILLMTPAERRNDSKDLTKNFSKPSIDDSDETDFEMVTLDDVVNKKNMGKFEYNYHKDPDVFYTHFLLPVQQQCLKILNDRIVADAFGNAENKTPDNVAAALEKFNTSVMKPIVDLSDKHVAPMIALLKETAKFDPNSPIKNNVDLQNALGRLGSDDAEKDRAACRAWCEINKDSKNPAVKAITHYVEACHTAAQMHQSLAGAHACVTMEKVVNALIDNITTSGSSITAQLKENSFDSPELAAIKNAFSKRISSKIETLLADYKDVLAKNGHADETRTKEIAALVNTFGSDAQKEALTKLQNTENIIAQMHEGNSVDMSQVQDPELLKAAVYSRLQTVTDKTERVYEFIRAAAELALNTSDAEYSYAIIEKVQSIVLSCIAANNIVGFTLLLHDPDFRDALDKKKLVEALIQAQPKNSGVKIGPFVDACGDLVVDRAKDILFSGFKESEVLAREVIPKTTLRGGAAFTVNVARGAEKANEMMAQNLKQTADLVIKLGTDKQKETLKSKLDAFIVMHDPKNKTPQGQYIAALNETAKEACKALESSLAQSSQAKQDKVSTNAALTSQQGTFPPARADGKPKNAAGDTIAPVPKDKSSPSP